MSNKLNSEEKLNFGIGHPVSAEKDILDFIQLMKKDFDIHFAEEDVKNIISFWKKNKKECKHFVVAKNEDDTLSARFFNDDEISFVLPNNQN